MGLGAALGGGIIMMMIVIVVGMATPAIMGSSAAINSAEMQRLQLDDTQDKTAIAITSLQAPHLSNTMSFTLDNTGSAKIWNYQKFTVIVTYNAEVTPLTSVRKTETLAYQGITQSPSQGFWSISQFNNDFTDPQIINPGESANIECHLSQLLFTSGNVTAIVSTDSGAQTSASGVIL